MDLMSYCEKIENCCILKFQNMVITEEKKNLLKCKPLKSNTRLHQSVAKAFLEEIHFHHYQI